MTIQTTVYNLSINLHVQYFPSKSISAGAEF